MSIFLGHNLNCGKTATTVASYIVYGRVESHDSCIEHNMNAYLFLRNIVDALHASGAEAHDVV